MCADIYSWILISAYGKLGECALMNNIIPRAQASQKDPENREEQGKKEIRETVN